MKHCIYLLFFSIIFGLNATSQTLYLQPGISYTNYKLESDMGLDPKGLGGISGFIGFSYIDKDLWTLSSNIGFVQQRIRFGDDLSLTMDGITITTPAYIEQKDYFSFNTIFAIKKEVFNYLICYLEIGPKVNWLVGSSTTYKDTRKGSTIRTSPDEKKQLFGALTGLGLKLNFVDYQLGVGYQYTYDFTQVIENFGRYKSNTIFLSIGYKF